MLLLIIILCSSNTKHKNNLSKLWHNIATKYGRLCDGKCYIGLMMHAASHTSTLFTTLLIIFTNGIKRGLLGSELYYMCTRNLSIHLCWILCGLSRLRVLWHMARSDGYMRKISVSRGLSRLWLQTPKYPVNLFVSSKWVARDWMSSECSLASLASEWIKYS